MLYKKIDWNDSSLVEYRYWCDCHAEDHVLSLQFESGGTKNTIYLSITNGDHMGLWNKVKSAFKVLLGKKTCYVEVCIDSKDRAELAKIFADEEVFGHSKDDRYIERSTDISSGSIKAESLTLKDPDALNIKCKFPKEWIDDDSDPPPFI